MTLLLLRCTMSELSTLLPFIVAHCHWISSSLMLVQLGHNNQPSSHDRQRHTPPPPASRGPAFSHPSSIQDHIIRARPDRSPGLISLPLSGDIKDDKSGEGDRHPALVIMKDMMKMKMRRDTSQSPQSGSVCDFSRRR